MKANAYLVIAAFVVLAAFVYYPKPLQQKTEATLSWDVSGYYLYLPATFIYGDLKKLSFTDELMDKYNFSGSFYQAYRHDNGNMVMKYPIGLAILFLPFFLLGHLVALVSGFPADGFSAPYQWAISLGGLMISWLGLLVMFKVLREYYSSFASGVTLLLLVVATNYLNYAGIDHAMTHTWLFTLYALVLYYSLRWHKTFETRYALFLGLIIGLMVITRPTEIIAVMIPLLWGVDSMSAFRRNVLSLFKHRRSVLLAVVVGGLVISVQAAYWYYATGRPIEYSYQDQGFSWLHPHLYEGLLSFRKGWLIYTPFMVLLAPALLLAYKYKRAVFFLTTIFLTVSLYITFSWDVWWYGGSVGQRPLVQHYAVFILVLPCLIEAVRKANLAIRIPILLFVGFCAWYNVHLTYIAHKPNAPFKAEDMTKAYFLRTFGQTKSERLDLKLLDTDEDYKGRRFDIKNMGRLRFDEAPDKYELSVCRDSIGLMLTKQIQFSPALQIGAEELDRDHIWVRAIVQCNADQFEWEWWKMSQLILSFENGETIVKRKAVRIHRQINEGEWSKVWIDCSVPLTDFDRIKAFVWNADSDKQLCLTELILEGYH